MTPDGLGNTKTFLSDEPTVELILRARRGDHSAIDAILQRCLPPLTHWAHRRLPAVARGALDTADLVQEAAIRAIARLDRFEARHVGAMQAYLRQSVINRIRDEMRRVEPRLGASREPAVRHRSTETITISTLVLVLLIVVVVLLVA